MELKTNYHGYWPAYPEVNTWNHAPMAPEFFSGVAFKAGTTDMCEPMSTYVELYNYITT